MNGNDFNELETKDYKTPILDEFRYEDEMPVFFQEKIWHSDLFEYDDR